MTGNSTSLISNIGNLTFIQGVESGIVSATGISPAWADIVVSLAIIILSFIAAKAVKYFIIKIAPGLVSKTETSLDDEVLKAVNGPLQIFIFAIGVYLAFATLNDMPGAIMGDITVLLTIALIYTAAYMVANLAGALINWYRADIAPKTGSELDDALMPLLSKATGIIVFILASLMVLAILKIDITPLIATLGVGGIAVALAAQELLSNVFGAFAVLADRPYKIGDRIQLTSGMVGDVAEIGLRSTRIKTLDNKLIVIPNSDISKSNIINYSLPDTKIMFDISVGIAYGSDLEKATSILEDIAAHTESVLKDPPPKVYVRELGDFSINLVMLFWSSDYKLGWGMTDHIYRETLKRFKAEDIEIPFPVRSVIMERPNALPVEALTPPIKR